MLTNFKDIIDEVKKSKREFKLVVPCPYTEEIIQSVSMAKDCGICDIILVGNTEKMTDISNGLNIDINKFTVLEEKEDYEALKKSYDILIFDKADIIMKGLVHTSDFIKTLLKNKKFIKSKLLTHVSVHEINREKLLFITDPSIVVEPSLEDKVIILKNAVELLKALDINEPKIAVISCIEKSDSKIKSSKEAEKLVQYCNRNENIKGKIVGPLALDSAVSKESAKTKNISNEVVGDADILLMHNLDMGNVLSKALTYIGKFPTGGIVMGGRKPIILTSRSADGKERFNSIVLAAAMELKNK